MRRLEDVGRCERGRGCGRGYDVLVGVDACGGGACVERMQVQMLKTISAVMKTRSKPCKVNV